MERDIPVMRLGEVQGWEMMLLQWGIRGATVSMMSLRGEGGSCRIEVEEEKMFLERKWIGKGVQGGDDDEGRGKVPSWQETRFHHPAHCCYLLYGVL